MHLVEDIGISPWPVDVVEFGADAYAHRKQVYVRQLYKQVPQTAWVSCSSSKFEFQLQLESVRDKIPEWEPAPDRGLGPSVTHGWVAQPEWERSAAMARRTRGQYAAVCPRFQLTSHTQPTSTLLRIKCERLYFYKEVCSFVHWSRHYCWLSFHLYLYMYMFAAIQHLAQSETSFRSCDIKT